MTKGEAMRALVTQLLAAAAEEIFGLFERSTAEHEEQLGRLKEENERIQKQLDSVLKKPPVPLQTTDVRLLAVIKHENQDIEVPFTAVLVRTEEEQEKAQSSQPLHRHTEQMETAADGEDCGGHLQPARNSHPETHLQPSPSLDQEPPEPPHITEVQMELVTPVPVKSEPDEKEEEEEEAEEKPQSSLPQTEEQIEERSVAEIDVNVDDSEESRELQSGENIANPHVVSSKGHNGCETGKKKTFSCPCCSKVFKQNGNMRRHMALHTREKKQYQLIKHNSVSNRSLKLLQKTTKVNREPTDGPSTGEQKTMLTRNMVIHTGEKRFSCSLCGKIFTCNSMLTRHMVMHIGERNFSCSVCGKTFKHKSHLKDHMAVHTGERNFSCSLCSKSFTQKGSLTRHMDVHTGEKRFSCSVCEKSFAWYEQRKRHKCAGLRSSQLHQNREAEPGASSSTGQINRHIKEEEEELFTSVPVKTEDDEDKPQSSQPHHRLSCSLCGRRFKRKQNLKTHMAVHTGERRFSCSVCGKSFRLKGSLTAHMFVHTRERNFRCSVCSKTFKFKYHLKEHMAVHTGERNFSCSMCGKSFTQKGSLTRHMDAHTREKL